MSDSGADWLRLYQELLLPNKPQPLTTKHHDVNIFRAVLGTSWYAGEFLYVDQSLSGKLVGYQHVDDANTKGA